ncbi:MAG: S-layer homology domain-containing protein, partial [Peptoanaerobacter stomatis]|uniref:S-layer homology domain-containing protein n=1 Tax=Peptoanaerobacter stomatis TaxID=796937 RepID=UPI003FA19193
QNAIQTAKQKLNTINTVEDLQAAVNELDNAINTFKLSADAPETPLQKLYREFSEEIEAAKSLTDESDKFPQAYNILQSAIEKAETELNENKDNIHALKLSFNNFKISVVEYKDSNYTALEEIENILKQKDPDEYIMAQGVISATIYKLNDQEPSMADKSLVKPVRILLTNKGYRLVLAFRSANMGFLKGFLGELYADKNQGFNILEPISTYNVIDVYNDPETGKDIKMKGNKYPKETIVSIDKNTNLLPVKVYIPALENMSPGDGTKKANIQFDWNTLEINKVFTTSLKNKIAEAESITQGKKTSAAYQELQNAVQTAKQKLNTVNTIDDLQNAVNELQAAIDKFNSSADVLQEKVYTVNAKLIQIDTTTPMTLGTSMNKTVKLSEKDNTVKYEIQFKPFTENGKTLNIVELYSIENGESKKAKIIENSADEYNKTFIFTRQTLQEPDIMLDILTDLNIDKKENMQKFSLVFDWTTKKDFKKEPEKPVEEKVNLTLTGENISSNPAAGQIAKGTNVTVTVVPASNKEVQSFTVNGADKKSDLINNQYTFNIDRDTQINVEYKDITSPGNNNSGSGGGGGSSSSSENSGSTERGSSNNTVKETKQNETVTITEEEVAKSAPSVKNIKFKDVKDNHWAIDAIKFLAQKGIMVGTGNGNFEPNGKLSKVMLISILARISGDEIENAEKTNFTDIPQNAWYKNDVAWAVKIGIISVSGNKFNPNASLTRSETTVIIGKYLGNKNIKLEETNKQINFKDSKDIPASSMQYVEKLAKYGIIKGDASGKFNPESSLTRAETASIITRLIKAVGK